MDIVIDASIAIKWFKEKDEEYVGFALSIQEGKRLGDVEIIVPGLLFLEVLNAFLTKPDFTGEDIAAVKESLVKMNMKIIHPDSRLLGQAIDIAVKNSLTFYDALYIAIAGDADAILYTEDEEMVSCTGDYNFIRHIKDYS